MVSPNMGTYAATGSGSNMIAQVLGMADQNAAKKAKLSQTEAIMLYNIVRTTADHLVENYRNYKKVTTNLRTANADLNDLQSMVKDAKSKDNAQSIEMEYTLRKAQRDIDSINEDVKKYRQGLADLAGAEAIDKLDKQLQEEQDRLDPGAQVADKAPEKSTLNPSDTKSGDPRNILATDKNSPVGSNDKKISAAPVKPPM
jgi:chromosome segregation ATPase